MGVRGRSLTYLRISTVCDISCRYCGNLSTVATGIAIIVRKFSSVLKQKFTFTLGGYAPFTEIS